MRFQFKKDKRKNLTYQVIVNIPVMLSKSLNICVGDVFVWRLTIFDGKICPKLVRFRQSQMSNEIKLFKVFSQNKGKKLYVTFPSVLFSAMNYRKVEQFEWRLKMEIK